MIRSSIVAALAVASPAFAAEPICGPYRAIAATLTDQWREDVVGRGLTGEGQMIVIFADPEGDTWSALVVNADGSACMVAAGTAWEALPFPASGEKGQAMAGRSRPKGSVMAEVDKLLDGTRTAAQIAEILKCRPEYVRATAGRLGKPDKLRKVTATQGGAVAAGRLVTPEVRKWLMTAKPKDATIPEFIAAIVVDAYQDAMEGRTA